MGKPAAQRLARCDHSATRTWFAGSRRRPRRLSWFGFGSFWGHQRHFIASAIATENIDSRDWMVPDEPDALARHVAGVLRGPGCDATPGALTRLLGRDVWIDYVSDTGDDSAVSRSVADMLFRDYELPLDDSEQGGWVRRRAEISCCSAETPPIRWPPRARSPIVC